VAITRSLTLLSQEAKISGAGATSVNASPLMDIQSAHLAVPTRTSVAEITNSRTMIPRRLDSLNGSGATGVMDWHTQEMALEFARAGAVDTILVEAAIMFSVPQLKVKAIGRGVKSVSCSGLAEVLPGLVQLGVRTPRKALEFISFHLFDDERLIDERKL